MAEREQTLQYIREIYGTTVSEATLLRMLDENDGNLDRIISEAETLNLEDEKKKLQAERVAKSQREKEERQKELNAKVALLKKEVASEDITESFFIDVLEETKGDVGKAAGMLKETKKVDTFYPLPSDEKKEKPVLDVGSISRSEELDRQIREQQEILARIEEQRKAEERKMEEKIRRDFEEKSKRDQEEKAIREQEERVRREREERERARELEEKIRKEHEEQARREQEERARKEEADKRREAERLAREEDEKHRRESEAALRREQEERLRAFEQKMKEEKEALMREQQEISRRREEMEKVALEKKKMEEKARHLEEEMRRMEEESRRIEGEKRRLEEERKKEEERRVEEEKRREAEKAKGKEADVAPKAPTRPPKVCVYKHSDASITPAEFDKLVAMCILADIPKEEVGIIDVTNNLDVQSRLVDLCGHFEYPIIFIGENPGGSFEQVTKLSREGKIADLLNKPASSAAGGSGCPVDSAADLVKSVIINPNPEMHSIDSMSAEQTEEQLRLGVVGGMLGVTESVLSGVSSIVALPITILTWPFRSVATEEKLESGDEEYLVIQSNWYARSQWRTYRFKKDEFIRLHPNGQVRARHPYSALQSIEFTDRSNIILRYRGDEAPDYLRATQENIQKMVRRWTEMNKDVVVEGKGVL